MSGHAAEHYAVDNDPKSGDALCACGWRGWDYREHVIQVRVQSAEAERSRVESITYERLDALMYEASEHEESHADSWTNLLELLARERDGEACACGYGTGGVEHHALDCSRRNPPLLDGEA